jgi:response regulator RpfG family c-di-GMP phosphodiesterase
MRVMETEWEGQKAYLASLRDITERKLMQQELEINLDDLKQAVNGTIKAIASTVEIRDPYTSGHQHRVASLARAIAEQIKLSTDQAEGVYMAAAIHDIGKISLPAEILSKPVKLTDIEVQMIQLGRLPMLSFNTMNAWMDLAIPSTWPEAISFWRPEFWVSPMWLKPWPPIDPIDRPSD